MATTTATITVSPRQMIVTDLNNGVNTGFEITDKEAKDLFYAPEEWIEKWKGEYKQLRLEAAFEKQESKLAFLNMRMAQIIRRCVAFGVFKPELDTACVGPKGPATKAAWDKHELFKGSERYQRTEEEKKKKKKPIKRPPPQKTIFEIEDEKKANEALMNGFKKMAVNPPPSPQIPSPTTQCDLSWLLEDDEEDKAFDYISIQLENKKQTSEPPMKKRKYPLFSKIKMD